MRYAVILSGYSGMPCEELARLPFWWAAFLYAMAFNAMNSPALFAYVEDTHG